jgi:hypothetical protein
MENKKNKSLWENCGGRRTYLFCEVLLGVVHQTAFLSEMRRNILTEKEREKHKKRARTKKG